MENVGLFCASVDKFVCLNSILYTLCMCSTKEVNETDRRTSHGDNISLTEHNTAEHPVKGEKLLLIRRSYGTQSAWRQCIYVFEFAQIG